MCVRPQRDNALIARDLSFGSVAPAAILPVVFVVGLLRSHPRRVADGIVAPATA